MRGDSGATSGWIPQRAVPPPPRSSPTVIAASMMLPSMGESELRGAPPRSCWKPPVDREGWVQRMAGPHPDRGAHGDGTLRADTADGGTTEAWTIDRPPPVCVAGETTRADTADGGTTGADTAPPFECTVSPPLVGCRALPARRSAQCDRWEWRVRPFLFAFGRTKLSPIFRMALLCRTCWSGCSPPVARGLG